MSNRIATGELDLKLMLTSLEPILDSQEYVFCVVSEVPQNITPFATINEHEGTTLVLPRAQADSQGLAYDGVFSRITLSVHSSLMAVGLTAAVAKVLCEQNISANVIAGYYHDHVLVPKLRADDALAALNNLS